MNEQMTPTTPETAIPQWVEHLPAVSKELDAEITKELEEKISILKTEEKKLEDKLDGKSPL